MDIYSIVTDKIIANLEKGVIPWHKPWVGKEGAYNRISGNSYSLLNQMLLMHTGEYATFKQWADIGGKVKSGEKSEMVVFWKMRDVFEEDEETGEPVRKTIPILRYYNVFHISQVEGVEPLHTPLSISECDLSELADACIQNYLETENIKSVISERSNACYIPSRDVIEVPPMECFENMAEYYSTYFHEMVHSTGAETRLGRNLKTMFGSSEYAKEELVAELGAAFLLHQFDIETDSSFRNNTAYIQSWLSELKNDKKLIVSAASKAEKAVEFIQKEKATEQVA